MISFVIPGKPVAYMRPRFDGRTRRVYTHPRMRQWVDLCVLVARRAWECRAPLDVPVVVELTSVHSRPQRLIPRSRGGLASVATWSRLAQTYGPMEERIPHLVKPDVDNVAKLVLDGLVKAGVLQDDTRIVELVARKRYVALEGDAEGVEVSVGRWGAA